MGIANIVSLLNPEIVVLGGGLFQAADLFLEPVRREVGRWAQPLAARGGQDRALRARRGRRALRLRQAGLGCHQDGDTTGVRVPGEK